MAELFLLLLAVAMDIACRAWPAHLPFLLPFVFNAPVFLGSWLALLWYLRGLRHAAAKPGWVRRAFFFAGLAGIYFVLQTHFEYAAQHMFLLNRIQAVVLGMGAPFCIAIGWPSEVLAAGMPGWAVRGAKAAWARLRWLSHPLLAAPIFIATTDIWLIPPIHFAAMLSPALYAVMNLSCLAGGLLFWLMVLDPRPKPPCRFSYLTRAATGFLVMFPQVAVGAYIALSNQDLYSFYTLCGRLYPAISPAYDQMLGGLIQWIPPGMMNTAALIIGLNSLRLAEAEADKHFVPPPGAKVYEAKWTGR